MTNICEDTIKEHMDKEVLSKYITLKAEGKKLSNAGYELNNEAYNIYQEASKIEREKRIDMVKDWKVIKQDDKIYVRADDYFWLLNLDTIDIESYNGIINHWYGEVSEGTMEDVAKAAFKIVMKKLTSFFVIRENRKPLSLLSDEDKKIVKLKLWEELDNLF